MIKTIATGADDTNRHRLLIDAISDYAIYMLDAGGHVVSWNPGAQRFKGYTADEIVGEHFSRFYTPEDRAAGLPARCAARAREGRRLGLRACKSARNARRQSRRLYSP